MPTKIEWADESWNPVTGCSPISEGCQNCYARRMAKRLAGRAGYPESPHEFDVTGHPDKLEDPYHWRQPRTVFVVSMGDLFHEQVSWQDIERVFSVMTAHENRKHTFIVLTKRAERMHEFVTECYPGLDQCSPHIIGMVTVENQRCADERIPWLLKTLFAVRGVSAEPMLSAVNLNLAIFGTRDPEGMNAASFVDGLGYGLDWVVCGFETGPGARPGDFAWARDLLAQCKAAGVPFFWKRAGPRQETPPDLMVREWPGEA